MCRISPPSLLGPEIGLGILLCLGKSASVLLFFGSGGFQEGSKRLSEGFRVEDAIRTPFGVYFWLRTESRGPKQSRKSYRRYAFFVVFTFSACFGFGASFWTLWDPLLDVDLGPRPFETGLLGALGPAKSRSRLVFFGPERFQERPKRHPRDSKRHPRALQEASQTSRGSKTPPRGLGGPILTPFGKPRGLPKQ